MWSRRRFLETLSAAPLLAAARTGGGSDGKLYAATHGRGIWSIPQP
jgi:hypothetical protein